MCYKLAICLLSLAGLLFVVFSRTLFLGNGIGQGIYPMRLDDLFYWGQWSAFWLTIGALVLFSFCRWAQLDWKIIAPLAGLGLCVYFLLCSMPLLENRDRWVNGGLGLKVFLQTKHRQHAEQQVLQKRRTLFDGVWNNNQGIRLIVKDRHAQILQRAEITDLGSGDDEAYAEVSKDKISYDLACLRVTSEAVFGAGLETRTYPQLRIENAAGESTLTLTAPGQLLLVSRSRENWYRFKKEP